MSSMSGPQFGRPSRADLALLDALEATLKRFQGEEFKPNEIFSPLEGGLDNRLKTSLESGLMVFIESSAFRDAVERALANAAVMPDMEQPNVTVVLSLKGYMNKLIDDGILQDASGAIAMTVTNKVTDALFLANLGKEPKSRDEIVKEATRRNLQVSRPPPG